jgi:hypothetical protein
MGHPGSRRGGGAGARQWWKRAVVSATVLLGVASAVVAMPGMALAATGVSDVTVGVSPPTSAAGGLTTYVVSFTTSSAGSLSAAAGSTVTIALTANTGLSSFDDGTPLDVGTSQVGYCEPTDTGATNPTVTCYLYSGNTVGASTTVTATLNGVTNPPPGSPTLTVSTSSDVMPVHSPTYTVTAARPVSGVGVTITPPTSATGGDTTYVVSFTTSSTGALDGTTGSTVTIALPANTGLGRFQDGSPLDVGTTQVGYCEPTDTSTSTPILTCYLYSGDTVGASTTVTARLNGITNPPAGSPTLAVSTSSDVNPANSPTYTVTAAQSVSGVGVTITPPTSAAGGETTYVVSFTTSSTGALDGTTGSTVTIALPADTGINNLQSGSPLDVGATQVGYCVASDTSTTTPTVTCFLYGGDTVGSSTAVTTTLNGVINPPAGSVTLAVSTASDTIPVSSPTYTVTPARSVSQPSVSLSNPIETSASTYTVSFETSTTGALDDGSAVTIVFPSGTDLSDVGTGTLDTGGTQVGSCARQSSTTVTCVVQGGSVAGGATVTATIPGVINPGAGFDTLSVSTTSDPTSVKSASYDIEAQVASTYSCKVPGFSTTNFPTVVSASTGPPSIIDAGGTFLTTLGSRLTIPASVINHFRGLGDTSLTVGSQTTSENGQTSGGSASGAVSPDTESTFATDLPQSDTLVADSSFTYTTTYNPVTWHSGPGSGVADFRPGAIDAVVTFVGSGTPTPVTIACTPPTGVADLGSTTVKPAPAAPTLQVASTPPLQAQVSAGTDGGWGATIADTSTATVTGLSATVSLSDGGAPVSYDLSGMRASGTSCSASGTGNITCSIGTLAAGATHTLAVLVNTTGLAQGTTISGSATITSANAGNRSTTFGPLKTIVVQGGNGITAVAAPGIALASTRAPLSKAKASVTLTLPTAKIKEAGRADQLSLTPWSASTTLVTPPPVAVTLESLAASKEPALCPPTGSLKCEGNIVQATGDFSAFTNKQSPITAVLRFFYGKSVPAGKVYMLEQNGKSVVKLAPCIKSASGYNTPCVSGKEVTGGTAGQDSLYAQDTVYFTGADPVMGRR